MAALIADAQIVKLLRSARRVAVVGISNKPDRASHHVATFLKGVGLNVVGVNPALAGKSIEGIPVVGTLAELQAPVDVVDVFRNSDVVPEIVAECIALHAKDTANAKALWLQEGVANQKAEEEAVRAGIDTVSNRCMLKEWERLGLPSKI